jgi:hypothetical protein
MDEFLEPLDDELLDAVMLMPSNYPTITKEMRDHANLLEMVAKEDEVPCEVWPDAFFPEQGENGSTTQWAKDQCAKCPALQLCAEYGLNHQPYHGIWGGLTVMDRRRINKLRGVDLFTPTSESLS